jgi:glycine/D-amino acid oxidase-like deaminating enzyme
MRRDCDVLVVGAGIVGAACAWVLQQAGRKVTVLDAAYPGTGATAACMGHVVIMDDSEAQMQLTTYSRCEWQKLALEMNPDCEDQEIGTLWVAADAEEMLAAEKKADYYARWEVETAILPAPEMYRRAPNLRPGLAGALWVPGDRAVYATRCASWFLRDVEVFAGVRVKAIGENGAVGDNGDFFAAQVVILACGADSRRLLPELPIEPRKGHLCITDRYPGFCAHQIVELGYLKSAHETTAESVAFNVQPRPN